MKYRLAVFDLDGTILDTLEDLADSTNHALAVNGLPERSIDEVRRFVGNGIRNLIERAVPEGAGEELTDTVFSEFREYYGIHCFDKTRPYEGMLECMEK
ncbi:MAG: HAD hydrolase-like protein, partial [Clostridia bacterium]